MPWSRTSRIAPGSPTASALVLRKRHFKNIGFIIIFISHFMKHATLLQPNFTSQSPHQPHLLLANELPRSTNLTIFVNFRVGSESGPLSFSRLAIGKSKPFSPTNFKHASSHFRVGRFVFGDCALAHPHRFWVLRHLSRVLANLRPLPIPQEFFEKPQNKGGKRGAVIVGRGVAARGRLRGAG